MKITEHWLVFGPKNGKVSFFPTRRGAREEAKNLATNEEPIRIYRVEEGVIAQVSYKHVQPTPAGAGGGRENNG